MQKTMIILLSTSIAVLLLTIKTSDSSYINCYDCQYNSTKSSDVSTSDVCFNPSDHSKSVPTCVGLRCNQTITICTGSDEDCKGLPRIKVARGCDNLTDSTDDVKDDCQALSLPPGNRKASVCICATEKCNGGGKTPKSDSAAKSVSPVVLVIMVFAQHFVTPGLYNCN